MLYQKFNNASENKYNFKRATGKNFVRAGKVVGYHSCALNTKPDIGKCKRKSVKGKAWTCGTYRQG